MSDKPTVVEALASVMEDVQAIRKGDRNDQQGFNFRGIDSVINAVGPALRKHGVIVVPTGAHYDQERYQSKSGASMRGITTSVCYRFYGPGGDWIDANVLGEAADSGDKAISKAFSVAYRTLLLQTLCVPTDEVDPDSHSHERVDRGPHAEAPNGSAGAGTESEATAHPAENPAEMIIPFGKHKGQPLSSAPKSYWEWWLTSDSASRPDFQGFRAAVELWLGLTTTAVGASDTDDIPF